MIWLLKCKTELTHLDTARGFVAQAQDEQGARGLAAGNCGDEGPDYWLSDQSSSCELLCRGRGRVQQPESIILRDFYGS